MKAGFCFGIRLFGTSEFILGNTVPFFSIALPQQNSSVVIRVIVCTFFVSTHNTTKAAGRSKKSGKISNRLADYIKTPLQ